MFFLRICTEFDHFKAVGPRGMRVGLNENPALLINNRNEIVDGGVFLVLFWGVFSLQ